MVDRDSCKKRNVWSAPEEKQILPICSKLEIPGQLDVCVTSEGVSSPILILNLRLLKVQPGRELSREPSEDVSINNEYEYENDFKPYSYSKSFSQLSMLAMTPSSSL